MDATTGITQCGKYTLSNWHYTGKNKDAERQVSNSIPLGFKGSGSFLVDTLHLKNAEDIKCDENGGWVNWGSGVSKLWLQSDL